VNGLLAENTKLIRATNMEFLLLLAFTAVHVPRCGGSSWEIITERRLLQLLALWSERHSTLARCYETDLHLGPVCYPHQLKLIVQFFELLLCRIPFIFPNLRLTLRASPLLRKVSGSSTTRCLAS
jgi:hypothetical protein